MANNKRTIHKLVKQLGIIWLIIVAVAGGFMAIIYQPLVQQRESLQNELAGQNNTIAMIRQKMLTRPADPQKLKLADEFLQNDSENDFMLSLEEIAEKNNLTVENIEPLKLSDDENNYREFKLLLTGNYFDLVNFVAKLENMQPFQQISTMNCKEKAGKLTIELEDIIFIQ